MRPASACEPTRIPVEEMGQSKSEVSAFAQLSQEVEAPEQGVFVFPASLEQIRYWTLDQLDGTSTASNMAIAARLEGEVDDAIVEHAIHAIVDRHEALRTTFRMVDGQLSQIISEVSHYNFSVTDLRPLPEPDRAQAAEAAVEEHSHARADLAEGPAFFVRLIHLSDQLHFLAFTMHHIVCDGWSNGILIHDFTEFYKAFSQNLEPELAELPFQFADFTVWQQDWLESDAAKAALAFWRKHIRRELPAVDLPTDRPRLPQKSYPGHIESTLLPAALTSRLKAYCRTHDATMHQVLLAAFEALIARYANQEEFLLGSTIANRTQPGMENVVGRFANPQVILADVKGDPSYAQLLNRVREWSTESYAHQDLPFSRLMEEFQLDQAGASSQFLQVYFVYQKAFMQPQEAPGLKVVPRPSVSGGVNFDLLVSIVERAEGPRLQMEYNTVLFRKERILGLIELYTRVLEAVMENDGLTVSQLPLLSRQSIDTQARIDNPAQAQSGLQAETATVSLAQWLDHQADTLADAAALLHGHQRISWKELQERSQIMASNLRTLGVAAGQVVALRLESTANDAAAAWALLRIGAIALPIPASASASEWAALLDSQQPAMALASSSFAAHDPGVTRYEELVSATSTDFQATAIEPSATAWIGLHAGRTGGWDAIPATHAATLQQLWAAATALDIRSGDAVLVTPVDSATDAWVNLLLPLVAGATLLYAAVDDSGKRQSWQALAEQHDISFVLTSTSNLLSAIHRRWKGDRGLNVVVTGNLLTGALTQRLAATPLRLWSILSSPFAAGPMALARVAGESKPQFMPLGSLGLAVIDDKDLPAPAGVSGELTVNGVSGRMRTGYLARTAPDQIRSSGIEILDTVDRLVRLHGYRLRLGELEDILWQNLNVAAAAAALVDVEGVATLAVYFQTFERNDDSARTVRASFQSAAPGHLSTAELIAVDSIPRLADGSADLAQLPLPGSGDPTPVSTDEYVPPRDELETNLVAIWEDVLGIRPIGIRTPFFKLGGYSLMIVRLFARINKALGISLPITTIFNAPTVEQLADIVRGRAYYSSLVPVQTSGTRPPFFMIHSYLLYQGIPAVLGPDYPFYGLRELDSDAENMTVEQRAAAYLDAMRSIQPKGPYFIGGWCAAGPLAVETARQIVASGEKVSFLVLFDSWRPGYAAELAKEQAGTPEMRLSARIDRKVRFHRNQLRPLSSAQRVRYVLGAISNKFASVRNRIYLKNWAIAEWFCSKFGLQLPHFMHNVSLTTLNSLKEYKGVEPYMGSLILIRAKQAPYIPGAKEHCGWNAIVKGGVKVLWAPGDHESMFLNPHLQTVGDLLRTSLAEAYAEAPSAKTTFVDA
jgi:thioesterase domain-containing protein/non-ribosomal peptide synthetase component F/acyl carrier protein